MAQAQDLTKAENSPTFQPRSVYEEATLGFREYWYPVCMPGDVSERPKAFTFLGDPVVLVKREGEIFALRDECPHRGTALSLVNTRNNLEFPGTMTITCAYHGWTYDVRDGKCVAVISEGPDSPVPAANIRAKTYPIEVRRGIVWIWMGSGKPVAVEEDMPQFILDPKAVVKGFYRQKDGNWRFHAENVQAGHAQMVHKSTLRNWFGAQQGTPRWPGEAGYAQDEDMRGVTSNVAGGQPQSNIQPRETRPYPGLGIWHNRPKWQRTLFSWVPRKRPTTIRGIRNGMLSLPGYYRQPNFPNNGYVYYEWYVPVDENHYIYMQIMAFWPKGLLDRLRWELKYYFWDRPTGPVLFNNQDAAMVAATTKYYNRTGNFRYLTKVSPNDQIDVQWRMYCDEFARGVGTAYKRPVQEEAGAAIEPAEMAVAGGD